ncbi:MAG: hypothetical protein KJN75_02555 [Muriicola sp.]|nr:hypothetical protein [Muriicola sp.]
MNSKFLMLLVLVSFLSSCMEESTVIYEQPVPIAQEVIIPEENKPDPEIPPATSEIYTWITHMQQSNGLVESAEFTDFVSLYDNALASLLFISEGDFERAEMIFDYFNQRLETEFYQNNGGFFQYRNTSGDNGARTWMGDNAWLLLAINNYHDKTNTQKYEILASELENWLRSLQDEDGGLRGGINEDGTSIPKVTEGIITAFNAVKGFDSFHEGILRFLQEQRWDQEELVLTTQSENPAYNNALDLHSLGSLIFESFPVEILSNASRYLTVQSSTTNGLTISGYCFDEDKDVVWLEGTAQMALAYQVAGIKEESATIVTNLQKAFIKSSMAENATGIPYTTNFGTNFGATFLWDHTDIAPAISSSAWYLFIENEFNPFEAERTKEIPAHMQFWNQGYAN